MKKFITFVSIFASVLCMAADDISYKAAHFDIPQKDTLNVLCIGNSFTFYYETQNMLMELAESQGHRINARAAYVGGYTFKRHLSDPNTLNAIENFSHAYDVVFLQNQSQMNAFLGRDTKQHKLTITDAAELSARVRQLSPKARIFFEATWSYPTSNFGSFGSYEEFDRCMTKGTQMIAKSCKADVSPIGEAFAIVRNERKDINLLFKDNKHQSIYGSYLKTCVNYLLIYHTAFDQNASNCTLEPEVAAYLRSVAQRVVLK